MSKTIMDTIILQIDSDPVIILDYVPCPSLSPSECLRMALEYYKELYPNGYVDVICNNPANK